MMRITDFMEFLNDCEQIGINFGRDSVEVFEGEHIPNEDGDYYAKVKLTRHGAREFSINVDEVKGYKRDGNTLPAENGYVASKERIIDWFAAIVMREPVCSYWGQRNKKYKSNLEGA